MKTTITVVLVAAFGMLQAQQASVASGGLATGAGGSASYSIGQVAFLTATSSTGSVSQGVQQPFEIVTLSGQEFQEISLQMVVYPNPTTSLVNLKIDNFDFQDLNYQLTDLNGRAITNQKISNSETSIPLENFSNAIYFLNVSKNNKTIKTFKIIKN